MEKLKAEKVKGIVIDLRNNGGGSLVEVVKMVGLFIKSGPIVQVKERDGRVDERTWRDNDESVLYDGPLTVMVNEL
ncbi:S41 family peptidase, partial [Klebsiella pneumoniae]|uniref:S41 family peptidase n=1 Tax=Klebsiella pneumoniae TaxID=573 RepID=UPI003D042F5F